MKKLLPLVVAAAALTSCDGNKVPPTVAPNPSVLISGVAPAVAGSTLSLRAHDNGVIGDPAQVASDGRFSVSLPVPPDTNRLTTVSQALAALPCTVSEPIVSSDPAARGLGIASAVSGNKTLMAGKVDRGLTTRYAEVHAWVYSDRATTLKGKLDCARVTNGAVATLPVDVNITLLPGAWTNVVGAINGSLNIFTMSISAEGKLLQGEEYNGQWLTLEQIQQLLQP